MKKTTLRIIGFTLALALVSGQASTAAAEMFEAAAAIQGRNGITGTVFGEGGRPVQDIYVELQNDFYSTIGRMKTDGSGRFSFNGLGEGRYKVKALPYGTDYMEQTQEIQLASVSGIPGSGSDRQNVDIYLRLNERAHAGPFSAAPGVIFVQEVPSSARTLYQAGINFLGVKKEKEGFDSLRKAIEIFPNYFQALDRLGGEYATRGGTDRSYYEAALVLLTKATQVNPRSFSSAFGLGWTQYQLGMTKEAIETLSRATTLYGKVADPYLWLGKALRRASTPDQAEVALKRANDLAKGKSAEVHWQLAALYRDQKRYKAAADELELFLKFEPKAADADKIRELIRQLREKTDGA